ARILPAARSLPGVKHDLAAWLVAIGITGAVGGCTNSDANPDADLSHLSDAQPTDARADAAGPDARADDALPPDARPPDALAPEGGPPDAAGCQNPRMCNNPFSSPCCPGYACMNVGGGDYECAPVAPDAASGDVLPPDARIADAQTPDAQVPDGPLPDAG